MLLEEFSAITVKLKGAPIVANKGAEMAKRVAPPEPPVVTAMGFEVPVTEPLAASVAVIVWLPAVRRVAWKVPVPEESVMLAGRAAAGSLEVKCTLPE